MFRRTLLLLALGFQPLSALAIDCKALIAREWDDATGDRIALGKELEPAVKELLATRADLTNSLLGAETPSQQTSLEMRIEAVRETLDQLVDKYGGLALKAIADIALSDQSPFVIRMVAMESLAELGMRAEPVSIRFLSLYENWALDFRSHLASPGAVAEHIVINPPVEELRKLLYVVLAQGAGPQLALKFQMGRTLSRILWNPRPLFVIQRRLFRACRTSLAEGLRSERTFVQEHAITVMGSSSIPDAEAILDELFVAMRTSDVTAEPHNPGWFRHAHTVAELMLSTNKPKAKLQTHLNAADERLMELWEQQIVLDGTFGIATSDQVAMVALIRARRLGDAASGAPDPVIQELKTRIEETKGLPFTRTDLERLQVLAIAVSGGQSRLAPELERQLLAVITKLKADLQAEPQFPGGRRSGNQAALSERQEYTVKFLESLKDAPLNDPGAFAVATQGLSDLPEMADREYGGSKADRVSAVREAWSFTGPTK